MKSFSHTPPTFPLLEQTFRRVLEAMIPLGSILRGICGTMAIFLRLLHGMVCLSLVFASGWLLSLLIDTFFPLGSLTHF